MALRWHPDKATGDATKFRAIQEAWEALGDEERRIDYDFGGRRPPPDGPLAAPPGRSQPRPRRADQDRDSNSYHGHAAGEQSWWSHSDAFPDIDEVIFQGPHGEFRHVRSFDGSDDMRMPPGMPTFRGGCGPAWLWTAAGVWEYTRGAGAFGDPRDGDPFTPAHLSLVQATGRVGYEDLVRHGFIRRATNDKGFNSLDPPPGGYKAELWDWAAAGQPPGGALPWGATAKGPRSAGGGHAKGGGRQGAGNCRSRGRAPSPPPGSPSTAEHSPWSEPLGDGSGGVGDGLGTCLRCGASATTAAEKGRHERMSGHFGGFYIGGH